VAITPVSHSGGELPPAGADGTSQIIVVSDFHMSAGVDPASGTPDPHEYFRDDEAFVHFLEHLAQRGRHEARTWRLVILGDFLDFLHVPPPTGRGLLARRDTSEAAMLAKLDRIATGHRRVFASLGEFAASGSRVVVVPGNHDLELIRSSTQARFCELVDEACGQPGAATRIEFQPWIYYVPGVLYAEHGSQYHDINSVEQLLRRRDGAENGADALLGSLLTLYLLELDDVVGVGQDLGPPGRRALRALRSRPGLALRTLGIQGAFLGAAGRLLLDLLDPRRPRGRVSYWPELDAYARALGIDAQAVRAIDRLAYVPALGVEKRALHTLAHVLLRRAERALAAGTRRTGQPLPAHEASDSLTEAAGAIHRLLAAAGQSVPYYVLGHTHRARVAGLVAAASRPQYANCGTWSLLVPRGADPSTSRFTFVEITRARTNADPVLRLVRWNDADRREESATEVKGDQATLAS